MNLDNLKNLLQNFEEMEPNEVATALNQENLFDMNGNLYDLAKVVMDMFPGSVWSISKPVQGKKPPLYENKAKGIKKKLPYEAFITTDDKIGEASHFFASENSSDPQYAFAKTFVSLLIKVEEFKLNQQKSKVK